MKKTYAVVGSAKPFNDERSQYLDLKMGLNEIGLVESCLESCDYLIFVNYDKKLMRRYFSIGDESTKLILIRLEPLAVLPVQYNKNIESYFDLIIDPGGIATSDPNKCFIGWPYIATKDPSNPGQETLDLTAKISMAVENDLFSYEKWISRKNKMVHIAANKVSPTTKSNYRLRRTLAQEFNSEELDIYGHLWDYPVWKKIFHRIKVYRYAVTTGYCPNFIEIYGSLFSKYKNFVSEPLDKHEIIKEYRFSLVIENSSTYCSEKLFDAILNGSIPIYVGPRNESLLLPPNLYFASTGSVKEIRSFIENINANEANDMLNSMKTFITSQCFVLNWDSKNVYLKIAKMISDL
jgi:hypothetical protein